ncbi:MAG TPA: adenylate/guanylate cyclase domain-containing protein, partial [Acidimicrobiales bacterium]|nr:adenylate/guanylate cyclase domain-containing protein [Acidimicrobiales bacterium]
MAAPLVAADLVEIRRDILRRGALVGAPVAALFSAYMAIWQPPYGNYAWYWQMATNVGESLVYLVLILAFGKMLIDRYLARHRSWAMEGGPITDELCDDLVHLPARLATWEVGANLLIIAIGTIANVRSHIPVEEDMGYAIAFFLLGFTFAAIVYLQTERSLRPLYERAFATSLPARRTVGVLPRLVLSWGVGSAVPLVLIAIIPLRSHKGHVLPLTAPMLYVAIAGVIVGAATAVLAARSVAEPVDAVRGGLEQVRDGDESVSVEVTRPGDLGALQAGFNNMVDAIRTRRQLQDLFRRQVGIEVDDAVLQSGIELGGEGREVSVLFVDLIGSSRLAEEAPPRQVVALLNTMFDTVVQVVAAEGGLVNKFEGDGCLCVFGAPVARPDHAARALRAARLLGERFRASNIDAGIGVSSGEVVAGNVGASTRFEY